MNTYVHVIISTKTPATNSLHMLYILASAVPTDTHLQQQIKSAANYCKQQSSHITASTQLTLAHLRNDDIHIHTSSTSICVCFNTMGTPTLAPRRSTGEIYDTV